MHDITPRPYQVEAISGCLEALKINQKVGCISPTGCLTGDTMIPVNRGGNARQYSLESLYNHYNGIINSTTKKHWDLSIPSRVRSFDGKEIHLHPIITVVYSGIKEVFKLRLNNGKSIKATACHNIMTDKGWVPLGELVIGQHKVMIDTPNPTKTPNKIRAKKLYDTHVHELPYHPFANLIYTNKWEKGYTTRIEKHRGIYEAHFNGLTLDEYKNILRTDPERSRQLIYLDPNEYHIHHKDGDHYNNETSNLEAISKLDHYRLHGDSKHFNQGIPKFVNIADIKPYGMEKTYDIQCEDPHHNFVANGIVVHNSGKSIIFIAICEKYLAENKTKSILILSHKTDLVTQTLRMFKLYTKGIKVGILQGNNIPNITDRVILSTMQSAKDHERIEKFKRRALFGDIGLIIVDECHYIPVNSYDKVFEMLPDSKILGFTATPWRTRQLMTSYFDAIGYSLSLGDLVDQGVLLKPILYEIKFDSCDDQDRIESVVKICEKEKKNSGIIYVNTIAQAEAYRNVLLSFEYKAACITSHTPKATRDRILLEFREGTTKILVNVNCLTEGIDAPIAEYIVMPLGTKSPTVFQQRIGRVLRTYKEQKEARIYVYGDTPAIAKGTYKKILKATLNDGTSNPLKKDDIFDELEWLEAAEERNTERIEWTRTICETIQLMKGKGIDKFAALLTQKKFPNKYLKDFANFRKYMTNEGPNDRNKISEKQTEILTEKGFEKEHLDTLTVHDASAIISSIISYENRHGEWSVNFGKHKGKHIKELPGPYLGFIASKNPRHPVFLLRKKWNQLQKGK